jgi:hypothetical protein
MSLLRGLSCFVVLLALCTSASAKRRDHAYLFDSASTEDDNDFGERTANDDDYRIVSICSDGEGRVYSVEGSECESKVATGKYRNAVNETGWGYLEIETYDKFSAETQAYAAGLAEGILTKLQIYYHYRNTVENMCKNYTQYCRQLNDYIQKNLDWIHSQVVKVSPEDLYWRQVNLTFTQMTGIWHGYSKPKQSFSPSVSFDNNAILTIQLSGELIDLEKYLNKKPDPVHDDPEPSKCSGLVKITEGNRDLLVSHVAMSGYHTMNRVLKKYTFGYSKKDVPGYAVSFSGYAGALASADDYTLTSAGLLSIETTISVFNKTLYDTYISPVGQLHCWVRSIVANQLASSAHEWVKIFALYNSGTYNNQWTVVDYKKFNPGKELPNEDVVWIVEQVPGFTQSSDVTRFLRKYSYWPSYNIPYLSKISKLSGFVQKGSEQNWWRWGKSPRAQIFHRDQHKVKDLNSLRKLMRYNDYKHDELSRCQCNPPYTAEAGISARGDLNPANGTYVVAGMGHRNHGSLDYKGTNYELFQQLKFQAVGGPTWNDYGPIPPFNWNTTDIQAPHYGQPTLWKFDPVTFPHSSLNVEL